MPADAVDRDGKIQVLPAVLGGDDPDELSQGVDQGASRAPAADRRCGLDDRGEIRGVGRGGALESADDSRRDRMSQSVRITDDESWLPQDEIVTPSNRQEGKGMAGLDLQDGDVLLRQARQYLEDVLATIVEEGEALGPVDIASHCLDDVIVGQDISGRMDDRSASRGEVDEPRLPAGLEGA